MLRLPAPRPAATPPGSRRMAPPLALWASALSLALAVAAHAASWHHVNDVVLFDPDVAGAQGWGEPDGLSMSAAPGVLQLDVRQTDSRIARSGLSVDPGMVEWLHLRYRATGFAGVQTHGQMFYANARHGFADHQYVHLQALVTDGQWQDMWVNIPRAMRGEADDWWDGGTLTALRLDMVDEAPGSIEISAMRLTAQRDDVLVPEPARALTRWTDPVGLSFTQDAGVLALDISDLDCRLDSAEVPLDPTVVRYLAIRYRAWGFAAASTSGQVFYANSRHGVEEAHRLALPSLTTDGQWHDIVIDVAEALGREYGDWARGGPLTRLRLDLVDQAPGKAEVALVLGAARLHITSEADLVMPEGRHWLLPASAFGAPEGPACPCALTLPPGQYGIWLRVADTPAGRAALAQVSVDGVTPPPLAGEGSGGLAWVRAGASAGGTLTLSRPDGAGILLDAVAITEGTAPPRDRPVVVPQPVTSTVRPLPPRRLALLGPYWQGAMLACPQAGERDEALRATRTVFRRSFEAPADLVSAWLQITVDDYFRLYLNGEEVARNLKPDSWMTPTLVDVTGLLRPGQSNGVAVEALNAGGAQGVLFDLVMNRPDHSCVRVVSDAGWRCSGTAPEGWTAPGFDDSGWSAPVLQPAPPAAPWAVELPYANKAWEVPTRLLALEARPSVRAGEGQEFACRFQSEEPVGAGDVLTAALTRTDTGQTVLERKLPLEATQCQVQPDGSVTVSGLSLPISRWLPSMPLELRIGLLGRDLAETPGPTVRFAYTNDVPPASLTSEVRVIGGVPRLVVNGQPLFAMVGNGEGRDRTGTADAFKAAGFNVSAIWVDAMGQPQWWRGPGEYDFTHVDELIRQTLDHDPPTLVLPIIWAAPPPWWGERYPEEMARFSDGTTWSYYRSAHSFSSQRWRQDAARALTAFVQHLEQAPYASRILGYWVIGGVSAEWQGWGCHGSAGANHLMDYSAPARQAFAAFLQERYPDHPEWAQAGIPDLTTRLGRELGVFRDPAQAGPSIAFNQMYSQSVTDAVLTCAGAAKAASGRRKIVGAYFGYSLEYPDMDWCLQMSGHNDLRRVLDSPDIDFLSAPHSYGVRRLGEDMGWMWAFTSIDHAGKLFWPDDDSRTHLSGPADYSPTVNPAQTREVLRRNLGKELCHVNPVGFLQIESGHELGSPAIARDCRITRRAGEFALRKSVARHAEIAVVIDEESVSYLAYDTGRLASGETAPVTAWNGDQWVYGRTVNNLASELLSRQRERLARIGAPVDVMLMSDFRKAPLDYKLYIMLSCFQYDPASLAAIRQQVQERGATVLWCYAPGFIAGGKADVANMRALTGLDLEMVEGPSAPVVNVTDLTGPLTSGGLQSLSFGAPYELRPLFAVRDPEAETLGVYRDTGQVALAARQVGRGRALFCGSHILPPDLLRNIARAAGVHIYSDSGDVLTANDNFVMLHTSTAGDKTITLPRRADVVDVYEGRVLFRDVATFTLNEAAQTTRLLYAGDAGEFLRDMDYGGLDQP
jgi:hypothetical protein